MKLIQVVIVIFSPMAVSLGNSVFRSKLLCRLLAALLFCVALVLVMLPDLTTDLARTLGVGRGTDLLLYIVFFAVVHAFLLLYSRTRKIEGKLTDAIRALAIRQATSIDPETHASIEIPRWN